MNGRGFYFVVAAVAAIMVAGVAVVAGIGGDQSASTIGQLLGFGGLLLVAVRNGANVADAKTTVEDTASKVDDVHAKLNGQLSEAIAAGVLAALNTRYPAQWGPPTSSGPSTSPPRA
jgi:hypothetical protein